MKRFVFVLLIIFAMFSAQLNAETKKGEALITNQEAWVIVESCTSSGNEPNDLADTERTYLTVKAAVLAAASTTDGDIEIEIYQIPYWYNGGRFRCIGITNDASVTHQIYLGTIGKDSDCVLTKAGQLAWTIGTQTSTISGYELADAVTVTAYGYSWNAAISPGSNLVAEAEVDFKGADILVVVTTTSTVDSKLLLKGY